MAMATEPAPEPAQGGFPFTRGDLEGMPDGGRRYEIIDGVLIVSAPFPVTVVPADLVR